MSCQKPRPRAFCVLCVIVLCATLYAQPVNAQYGPPGVQVLSLASSRHGVVASDAFLAMDDALDASAFFAVLAGVTDWNSTGTTFMEAGAQRCALYASCDAVRPYAASQIADTDYDLRIYDRVLGEGAFYRFRVERLDEPGLTTTWRALVCTGSSGCREIMRRDLLVAQFPYAVVGAESNGAAWTTLHVRNARLREARALRWMDWCTASTVSIIWPNDGHSAISSCDDRLGTWTVTRQPSDE